VKITDVEVRVLRDPFPGELQSPRRPKIHMDSALVRVHTESGHWGIGESFLVHTSAEPLAQTVAGALAPILIGEDPFQTDRLWNRMWSTISRVRLTKALSAVDQALWDLKARVLEVPLYQLLGGRLRDSVTPYGTVARRSEDYADDVAVLADHHFKAAKIAVGNGVQEDLRTVNQVVERVAGRMALGMDANGRYDVDDALALSTAVESLGLLWFEEPVPFTDVGGLAELRRRTRIPIAGFQEEATIWRLRDYLEKDALSIYNVCLDLCGGPTVGLKMNAMVEAWNKKTAPHTFGPLVNFAATLHLAMASPNCEFIEYPIPDARSDDPAGWGWAPHVRNRHLFRPDDQGELRAPDLPGNGVELDELVLRELTVG
jgi:L-alanine-DL-glutamate epimerase-like enolase superfamily enzyme